MALSQEFQVRWNSSKVKWEECGYKQVTHIQVRWNSLKVNWEECGFKHGTHIWQI